VTETQSSTNSLDFKKAGAAARAACDFSSHRDDGEECDVSDDGAFDSSTEKLRHLIILAMVHMMYE
jgi:hypothetical protein